MALKRLLRGKTTSKQRKYNAFFSAAFNWPRKKYSPVKKSRLAEGRNREFTIGSASIAVDPTLKKSRSNASFKTIKLIEKARQKMARLTYKKRKIANRARQQRKKMLNSIV